MNTSSFREELVSQIPALQLLMALGWEYLPPDEALALRGGNLREVVLSGVLQAWLQVHNGGNEEDLHKYAVYEAYMARGTGAGALNPRAARCDACRGGHFPAY